MANQLSYEDFKAACKAGITRDGDLVVACRLANGKKFSHRIPLRPIVEKIKAMIADYHRRVLHGNMSEDTISGLGDWFNSAVDAAKSIAHSSAVKAIYHAIDDHKKEIALGIATAAGGPGAAMQVNQAFTAYDQMMKAKGGDPSAAQQISNVKDAAADGNPKAQDLMTMMRAMLGMMNMKDAKSASSPGTAVSGRKHANHRGGWGKARASGAKPPANRAATYDTSRNAPRDPNNRGSVDKWGSPGAPGASDGGGDDGDDYDDQDQDMGKNHGWLYNRPYRTQATSIGPALRTLYALGAG